ncbi:MAG TPA: dihydroorotase [Flavobacteriaceae bacterium]|nr:dihydroorotase [Flavobacteriaceae bacterium]|tara:strand:- start:1356 stop:2609 length:1254 start_codon:yes stop_codon:yes gene_type:complete
MNSLIKAATIIDKKSEFHNSKVDILIENNIITNVDRKLSNPKNYPEISLNNLHVSKGWFDSSVCFGEPGYEERETISNGIKVAAKSGFTNIVLQPNTYPVIEKNTEIEYLNSITKNSIVNVFPIGALSKSSSGKELSEMLDMKDSGAIAFNDYKKPISNPNLLKLALEYTSASNTPIFSYPQDDKIAQDGVMNEGIISTSLGLNGIPSIAEEINIARDLSILEYTEGNLHIPTISSANSVELIRKAKAKKLNISCSVAIHNLFFLDESIQNFDTKFKVSPPLRTSDDVNALIAGLKDGTIDMVTSDHNPLNIELKNLEFDNADYGTIGLESAFSALNMLFPIKTTINLLTRGKHIFGIENDYIKIGHTADLTLFNPLSEYIFNEENILSKSKNSIFIGSKLKGKVYGIINNGLIELN